MRVRRGFPLIAAAGLLAGCAQLLPKSQTEVSSPWRSFDEAKSAIERIEPDKTTAGDLRALGIDPYTAPNIQLLSYSDILLRFPVSGTLAQERLDRGLRECLEAGKTCTGYAITARGTTRDRVGNFWQDALGFKRVVEISGWSFNALVLMVGDRVVYTLYGGQPMLREQEVTRKPLGPVQDWGNALPVGDLLR